MPSDVNTMTADQMFIEAVAYGTGHKSMRNAYGGWIGEQTAAEARDASIATTDAMMAMGYYYAGMAQKEVTERRDDILEIAGRFIAAVEEAMEFLPEPIQKELRKRLADGLRDVSN